MGLSAVYHWKDWYLHSLFHDIHAIVLINKRIYSQSGEYRGYEYLKGHNVTKLKDGYYVLLPDNISELNRYMCGPLNREDTWYNLLLYPYIILLQFIPITVFCLLILVFQIRLTSAPMTCFIMYSQLVVLAFCEDCNRWAACSVKLIGQVKFIDSGETRTLRVGTNYCKADQKNEIIIHIERVDAKVGGENITMSYTVHS